MRVNWKDDSGLSLTELLVVAMLLGFILAAAWSVMYAVNALSSSLAARAVAADESQVFLDNIGRELREADSLKSFAAMDPTGAGAFSEIATRSTTFYVDIYHDGTPEKIQYTVSNGSLYRYQWAPTTNVYPYTWPTTPTKSSVVIKNIDPSWNGSIFTYYTNDNLPPTQITDISKVASVTAVMVQVQSIQPWNDKSVSFGASTTVRVRAIQGKF
jgi:type II secretory pathway component PulJ